MNIAPNGILAVGLIEYLPLKRSQSSENLHDEVKRQKLPPYMTPPKGSCPFLELPQELITNVFSEYLKLNITWQEAGRLAITCKRLNVTFQSAQLLGQFFSQGGVGSLGMNGKLAVKVASAYCAILPNLTLCFDRASKLRTEDLSLLSACSNLQTLSLSDLDRVSNIGLVDALKPNTTLQELTINYCPRISEAGLIQVLRVCKTIKKLRWDTSGAFTDKSVINIAANCPDLRILHTESGIINEEAMKILAKGCTKLETIYIFQFGYQNTDEGLVEIAKNCTKLKRLELQFDGLFTDKVLTTLGNCCKELQVLRFTELTLDRGMLITDVGLQALAEGCTNLQSLSLTQCKSLLTHRSITSIVMHCTRLAQLSLQSPYIGNTALIAIGRYCSSMTSLTMNNAQITDQGLANYAKLLHSKITMVSFNQCDRITDIGIAALARFTPYLHSISLLGCSRITVTGIEVLAQNHRDKDLIINLYFCEQFNDRNIGYLRSAYPKLKIQTQFF